MASNRVEDKIADHGVSGVGSARFRPPDVYRQKSQMLYNMAVDFFCTGGVFLFVFNVELEFGGCRSKDGFNHSLGGDIEKAIGLAQSQEKVMALETAQLMLTFEAKDRPTIAGCFDKQSRREWRPDHQGAATP